MGVDVVALRPPPRPMSRRSGHRVNLDGLGGDGKGVGRRTRRRSSSFDGFYRSNVRGLVALGWSLTGDPDVAADLAHYAMGEAAASWERVELLERPDLWVRRVVINRSATHFRTRERQQRALVAVGPSTQPDELELSESTARFFELVRELPPLQARVVTLHYLEDRAVAEIAQVLDVTTGTVKTSLHRARVSLARRLRGEQDRPDIDDPISSEEPA